jgi:hypothetical protein
MSHMTNLFLIFCLWFFWLFMSKVFLWFFWLFMSKVFLWFFWLFMSKVFYDSFDYLCLKYFYDSFDYLCLKKYVFIYHLSVFSLSTEYSTHFLLHLLPEAFSHIHLWEQNLFINNFFLSANNNFFFPMQILFQPDNVAQYHLQAVRFTTSFFCVFILAFWIAGFNI